jgi:hypothetical protein
MKNVILIILSMTFLSCNETSKNKLYSFKINEEDQNQLNYKTRKGLQKPIIEIIKEKGTFKTKPLDGILVHIALKKLREEFPDKYVAVKTNVRGDKYVLVNEYRAREI